MEMASFSCLEMIKVPLQVLLWPDVITGEVVQALTGSEGHVTGLEKAAQNGKFNHYVRILQENNLWWILEALRQMTRVVAANVISLP